MGAGCVLPFQVSHPSGAVSLWDDGAHPRVLLAGGTCVWGDFL